MEKLRHSEHAECRDEDDLSSHGVIIAQT